MSPIQDFYANQVIFLTGVTGFIGKLIVEKLLRTCPNLKKIYALVRPKHNRTHDERFKEIFNAQCFEIVKSLDPNFSKKVYFLSGDCSQPSLGLSPEALEILKNEVSCVFHIAANVRFDVPMRTAVHTNVRSVYDLLDIVKEMKNLRAFVHVSTAFSHCTRKDIGEEFYDVDIKPEKLMQIVDITDDNMLNTITPLLLGKWPNTYAFTKAIAEEVIRTCKHDLPIAIVRPSIVTAPYKEPMPGWTDNFQGVTGLIIGASLGVVRSLHVDVKNRAIVVPCDFVVNNILAAAWNTEMPKKEAKGKRVIIYNFTGDKSNIATWSWIMNNAKKYAFVYSLNDAVWHPYLQTTRYKVVHEVRVFVYHTVVSYLADAVLYVAGQKTLAVEKYRKINKLINVTSYFGINVWNFDTKNVDVLWDKLDQQDKEMFSFNTKDWNLETYLRDCLIGGRVFLLKDPLETLPKAIKKAYFLAAINYIFVGFVMYLWYWLFSRIFSLIF